MRERRIRCLAAAMMAMLATVSVAGQTGTKNKTETRVETKPIPFKVGYEFSRTVTTGRLITSKKGKPGQVINTYTVFFRNGRPYSKKLISTQRVDPVDEVVLMGKGGFATSRHKFTRGKILTMVASAYDPSPRTVPGTSGHTSTGMRAGYGVAAVDPGVIPLGSIIYVEGYGVAIAADRGSAIKGNRIDLCFEKRSSAMCFGRKKVRVHVLSGV